MNDDDEYGSNLDDLCMTTLIYFTKKIWKEKKLMLMLIKWNAEKLTTTHHS